MFLNPPHATCCELWKVFFGMAVRAQQRALVCFRPNLPCTSIRQRTHVHFKTLRFRVAVMPRQRGVVAIVSASRTAAAIFCHQLQLSLQPPRLLCRVALVVVVRVFVLASTRAIFALPPAQRFGTNAAKKSSRHMSKIISHKMNWPKSPGSPTMIGTGL